MEPDRAYIIGRADRAHRVFPDLDMSTFEGNYRSVSRVHASLQLENNVIYICDLGSRNGTYLWGLRLRPNRRAPLQNHAELRLGELIIRVEIETSSAFLELASSE